MKWEMGKLGCFNRGESREGKREEEEGGIYNNKGVWKSHRETD